MQKLKINDDHKMHEINTSDKMCKINMSKNAQVGGLFKFCVFTLCTMVLNH